MSGKNLQDFQDLLMDKKAICTVAINRPNQSPHLTPVWFEVTQENFNNKELTFNTLQGRVKANLLKAGTKISINIIDPDQPSRYLSIDGTVEKLVSGEEGIKHINKLSRKYTGHDADFLEPGNERIKYIVKMNQFY